MCRRGAGRCADERGGAERRLMLRRNNRSDRLLLQEETRKSCLKRLETRRCGRRGSSSPAGPEQDPSRTRAEPEQDPSRTPAGPEQDQVSPAALLSLQKSL